MGSHKIYGLPKTRIGKISLWPAVCGFALLFIQYWIALLIQSDSPQDAPEGLALIAKIIPGLISLLAICTAGIISIIAIIKYKDYSIFLIIPIIISLFGFMLILGEILIPH